ncbi:MAG: stage II sporulation protein R [Clostridiales bacterium]|mgnify:FL=1|jgi:stage II sporulation protein R|nr:stage II sporulation protein R [Clostridiales bacterium]
MKQHLKIWEISLLFALCATLFTGLFARAEQQQLAGQLVRLHVIANSDSESDQHAKLSVRDSVLQELTPMLEGISDINEAEIVISEEIPKLCQSARQSLKRFGKYYPVSAKLCLENYPTRNYDGFALPAGDYISLQIILGEGKGRNWWCVVFPPLCMTSVEDEDAFYGMSQESAKLIQTVDSEYRLKFRIIELYDQIRNALS